jgi:hypothetical protein
MSRLIFTERGRVLLHANEEIARWRWARKLLRVGQQVERAELWLFVRPYPGCKHPHKIEINEKPAATIRAEPKAESSWQWRRVPIARGVLRRGVNEILVRCDSAAMNSWMLGIENGHANPKSFLSTDRGRTWQNKSMGASGVLRGEYLIRLRADGDSLRDPPPPQIVYENRKHPRVRELRELIPASIRRMSDPWRQVLALRTWVTQSWKYEAFGRSYSPPDPWTVLAWKRDNWGHGYENPIAMCVHYGMVFTSLAAALGHDARGFAITQDVNSPHGHFMTEIWDKRHKKWIAHDASYDLHYGTDQPMSATELADTSRRNNLRDAMRRGPGFTSNDPRLLQILNQQLKTGKSFAHVGIWRLNDLISNPSSAPPSHGSVNYCETDFVWYVPVGEDRLEMFPYHTGDREYFALPASR